LRVLLLVGLGQLSASSSLDFAAWACIAPAILFLAFHARVVLHYDNHLLIVGIIVYGVADRMSVITSSPAAASTHVLNLFFLHFLHLLARRLDLRETLASLAQPVRIPLRHLVLRWLINRLQGGIALPLQAHKSFLLAHEQILVKLLVLLLLLL